MPLILFELRSFQNHFADISIIFNFCCDDRIYEILIQNILCLLGSEYFIKLWKKIYNMNMNRKLAKN